MKQLVAISLALFLVAVLAPEASAWRGGGGVYRGGGGAGAIRGPGGGGAIRGPGGGYAVRGPGGGVAVGRQGGGYAVRGPTTVYGGAYGDRAPVAAGVVAGAAVVGAAAIMRSHIIPPVRATLYAVLSLTLRDPQW